jgi:hypothetical protein
MAALPAAAEVQRLEERRSQLRGRQNRQKRNRINQQLAALRQEGPASTTGPRQARTRARPEGGASNKRRRLERASVVIAGRAGRRATRAAQGRVCAAVTGLFQCPSATARRLASAVIVKYLGRRRPSSKARVAVPAGPSRPALDRALARLALTKDVRRVAMLAATVTRLRGQVADEETPQIPASEVIDLVAPGVVGLVSVCPSSGVEVNVTLEQRLQPARGGAPFAMTMAAAAGGGLWALQGAPTLTKRQKKRARKAARRRKRFGVRLAGAVRLGRIEPPHDSLSEVETSRVCREAETQIARMVASEMREAFVVEELDDPNYRTSKTPKYARGLAQFRKRYHSGEASPLDISVRGLLRQLKVLPQVKEGFQRYDACSLEGS